MKRLGYWPLLLVIVAIALALRLVGINWDQGLYLHPDERFVTWVTTDLRWPTSISQYFDTERSPLNPYNTDHGSFVYGTFPSFLVKAIAGLVDKDRYGELHLVGRAVSAVADTGTVLLSAVIARRFFRTLAGLLTATLLAFTPLLVQSAHYFTVDTLSLFLVVVAFACVVRSWDRNSIAWAAFAGVMIGLAGASKLNFLASIAFLGLPVAELIRTRGWRALLPRLHAQVYPALPAAVTGVIAAIWTFRVAQPYAFAGPYPWSLGLNQVWLDDLGFWRAAQTGLVDIKPSIQWVDRTPVVYLIENMVLWGMAPALGLASLVALALAAWRVLRSGRWPSWWWLGMLGWIAGNVLLFGTGIAQNQRYLMPIYPFLVLLAAGLLAELIHRVPRAWWPKMIAIVVVGYTVFYGVAFTSIFVRPITRIEASEWIYDNVPEGSVLTHEYWDDALPMPMPERNRAGYTHITVDLYAPEFQDSTKVSTLVAQLSQVDYVVLSSNRVIDSVVRQPERYPVAVRYYEMLLNGELGFEPVAEFRQGPEIFGIEWDDRGAEESLIVYEHPEVRIFRKTEAFDPQYVHDQLLQAWGTGGYQWIPGDPTPRQMLLSDSAVATNMEQGTWSEQVSDGWMSRHPLLMWYLGMQLVALAAWPLTWRAFRHLPDAGFALARGVGLLGTGAITLALVSWRGLVYGPSTVALAMVLLLAIGFACPRCVWEGALPSLRSRWRGVVAGELVFAVAFLIAALARMYQRISPDHNLMQLTGLMRSSDLPPADPWLSGGAMHVHWSGLLPWASLSRLLRTEPAVAYNLVVIGVVAVISVLAWSLVHALTRTAAAVVAPVLVVLASSTQFAGGLAPEWMGSSVDLPVSAAIVGMLVLIHTLAARQAGSYIQLALVALVTGAVMSSLGGGPLIAIATLAVGLAIPAWLQKPSTSPWWPVVRTWIVTLVVCLVIGAAMWWPAIAAHTATVRDLLAPEQFTPVQLWEQLGMVLLLVAAVLAAGAIAVLGDTMREGVAGIVSAGLALAAIAAMIVVALAQQSGLLLVFLLSLLTVIAVWNWLKQRALLWCGALIALAIAMLILAQVRPARADIAGVSQTQQLVPIAWMLFTLALGIVGAVLLKRARGRGMPMAIFGLAMICVALVLPTAFTSLDLVRENDRVGLARSAVEQTEPYAQASAWLQQNAEGMPVVLTAMSQEMRSSSSIVGYPTVLNVPDAERRMRPGWHAMIDTRQSHVHAIYMPGTSWADTAPLLAQYDVAYIVVGPNERAAYGDDVSLKFDAAVAAGDLQVVYTADGVTMYHVNSLEQSESAPVDVIVRREYEVRP